MASKKERKAKEATYCQTNSEKLLFHGKKRERSHRGIMFDKKVKKRKEKRNIRT